MRVLPGLLLALACAPCLAQSYDGPIIDVHLHVGRAAPGAPNPATGVPTTANTDAEREAMTLERLRRHDIVLGLVSGPDEAMASMRKAGGDRIRAGAFLDDGRTPLPPPEVLREAFARGDLQVMGEIGAQYHGLDPSDEWFEPYLAIAEEFDVPVGIHTGLAPPGAAYGCCPGFRIELGNPLALEPMLKKHPKLRVWLMHAGWPFLAETKALLYMYPQVHADVSVINWIIPRAEFHEYLQGLVRAGLTDRLMFGSDQMVWPEAITQAIEGVDSAPFLTAADKRAIFHDNAARFLRLGDGSRIALLALGPAQLEETDLPGELACSYTDADLGTLLVARADVRPDGMVQAVINHNGYVERLANGRAGGFNDLLDGITLVGKGLTIRLEREEARATGDESTQHAARLIVQRADGAQRDYDGTWTCGP